MSAAKTPRDTTVPREAIILAGVLLASWYFVYLRYRLNQEFPLATLASFLDGTAHKPFQFRMLVPWLVGGLEWLGLADQATLYRLVDFAAVVGIFYSFRFYVSGFVSKDVAAFSSFGVFYALPWNYLLARDLPILLPYDLLSVAFMTLALAFIHRRNWRWFYPVFLIAALNRETILFVCIAFALSEYGKQSRRSLALHLAAQVAVLLVIRLTLATVYADNPGTAFEFYHVDTHIPHWRSNLQVLYTPPHVFLFLSNFGFAWVIVLAGWRYLKDDFLKMALWIILPYFLLTLIAGNINEIRVFGELLPLVMAPAVLIPLKALKENGRT